MWSGITPPGYGWATSPIPFGNPIPTAATGVSPAATPARLPVDAFGYAIATPAPGSFAGYNAFTGLQAAFASGVTAGAIIAAVAMRRGQPAGPTNDAEIEDFLYDALELIPGTSEAEVRCEGGRVTLSGNVPHKRQKHDVGEIAWAIPTVADVQNSVTIAARRRGRSAARENEAQTGGPVRKHA
jgi:hypothetical protein